jgi:hypothetical protein
MGKCYLNYSYSKKKWIAHIRLMGVEVYREEFDSKEQAEKQISKMGYLPVDDRYMV